MLPTLIPNIAVWVALIGGLVMIALGEIKIFGASKDLK